LNKEAVNIDIKIKTKTEECLGSPTLLLSNVTAGSNNYWKSFKIRISVEDEAAIGDARVILACIRLRWKTREWIVVNFDIEWKLNSDWDLLRFQDCWHIFLVQKQVFDRRVERR
jgi:hypothetical protein